jgi:hypothetical protein
MRIVTVWLAPWKLAPARSCAPTCLRGRDGLGWRLSGGFERAHIANAQQRSQEADRDRTCRRRGLELVRTQQEQRVEREPRELPRRQAVEGTFRDGPVRCRWLRRRWWPPRASDGAWYVSASFPPSPHGPTVEQRPVGGGGSRARSEGGQERQRRRASLRGVPIAGWPRPAEAARAIGAELRRDRLSVSASILAALWATRRMRSARCRRSSRS